MRNRALFSLLCLFSIFCFSFGAQQSIGPKDTLSPTNVQVKSTNPGVLHVSWDAPSGKCEDFGSSFDSFVLSYRKVGSEDILGLRCDASTLTSSQSTSTRCFVSTGMNAEFVVNLLCKDQVVYGSSNLTSSLWLTDSEAGTPTYLSVESFGTDSAVLTWKMEGSTCAQAGSAFVQWEFIAFNGESLTTLYHAETEETARSTVFPKLFPLSTYRLTLSQVCADKTKSSLTTEIDVTTPALTQSLSPHSVSAGGFDTEVLVHGNSTVVDVEVEGILACKFAGTARVGYSVEYSILDEYDFETTWHPMSCKLKVEIEEDDVEEFVGDIVARMGVAYFNCSVENDTKYKIRASVLCSDPFKSSNHTTSGSFKSMKDFSTAAAIDVLHENEAVLSPSIKVSVNQNTFAKGQSPVTGLTFNSISEESRRKRGVAVYPIPDEAVDTGSLNFELNGVTPSGPLGSDFTQNPLVLEINYLNYGLTDDKYEQFALYFLNTTTLKYQNVKDTCPPQFQLSTVDVEKHVWKVYICHLTEFRGFLVPSQVVVPVPTSSPATEPSSDQPADTISTVSGGFNAIGNNGVYYRNGWDRKTVAIAIVVSILGTILLVILVLLLIFILMRKRREVEREEEEPQVQMPRENVVLVYKSFIPVHNDDVNALSPKGIVGEMELRMDLGENDSSNDSHTESTGDSDSDNSDSDGTDGSESDFSKDNKSNDNGVTITADMSAFGGFNKSAPAPAPAPAASSSSPVVVPILATKQEESEEEKSEDDKSDSDSGSDESSGSSDSSDSEDSDDSESLKPQNA
eukprot:TRINITY_DN1495_c0_g1_i1.p1 TRINITY_DN1495_c0_g1~~TRINITY_DN1495_c0_g1_i1.p1  ORF type:complete len:817 (-),score=342.04 TRINITY_DN1495_c0_g1_i1:76-2463(-)